MASTTTYVLTPGSEVNCTVTGSPSATGNFTVTASVPGAWSFEYEIYCDGTPTGATATASGTAALPAPVDDPQGDVAVGGAVAVDVSGNDTVCPPTYTTTYVLVAGSPTNCTVTGSPSATGVFNVTVLSSGPFDFEYEVYCDGSPSGQTAVVSGTGVFQVVAVDDVDAVVRVPADAFSFNVSANDTPCP